MTLTAPISTKVMFTRQLFTKSDKLTLRHGWTWHPHKVIHLP